MLNKLYILFFFNILFLSESYSQHSFDHFINQPASYLSSCQNTTYLLDEQVHFVYAQVKAPYALLSVVVYRDTIVYAQAWQDESIFDEPSIYIGEFMDAKKLEACQSYIETSYGARLHLSSAPQGIVELKQVFGLHCGGAGSPTTLGAKYKKLSLSNLTEKEKMDLLTSIHPMNQLCGCLLLKKDPKFADHKFLKLVENNNFQMQFCYGCEGSTTTTLKEIVKEVEE